MNRTLLIVAVVAAIALAISLIVGCASPRPMTDGEGAAIAKHIKRSGL